MRPAWIRMRRPVTQGLIWIQAVWHLEYMLTNFERLWSALNIGAVEKLSRRRFYRQDKGEPFHCCHFNACVIFCLFNLFYKTVDLVSNSLDPDETSDLIKIQTICLIRLYLVAISKERVQLLLRLVVIHTRQDLVKIKPACTKNVCYSCRIQHKDSIAFYFQ